MTRHTELAISQPEELIFGHAKQPLTTRRGLVIGGGTIYPELNFTVPPMAIAEDSTIELTDMYRAIVRDACSRAVDLHLEGLVIEFETLIEMILHPSIAVALTAEIDSVLDSFYREHGLKSALRITVNDLREMRRPPLMREGDLLQTMLDAFRGCAGAGAELLSIESTGGKEIHDDALLMCDLRGVLFGLAVLGCRDMDFLWGEICTVAAETGTVPAGDTACGFGNTAMVLADRKFIPRVFAAVVRAVTAVRSLVAYEKGAVGPGKDCGYENIILKAVTGYPMSMEGKSSACAHLSPVGNVAAAAADLWSNESIQNVKLLGAMAPTVSLEQLVYDCRLMNVAEGRERQMLQSLLAKSDARLDPQALVLTPSSAIRIARAIVAGENRYDAARRAAGEAIALIRDAIREKQVSLPEMELPFLDSMQATVDELPDNESQFIEQTLPLLDSSKFLPDQYGLQHG